MAVNLTTVLQAEDLTTVEDIASDLFTDDLGIPYTDLSAIGANPVATIFRDGTVTGSTDNGKYYKLVSGELICEFPSFQTYDGDVATTSLSKTWSFPIAFVNSNMTLFSTPMTLNAVSLAGINDGFERRSSGITTTTAKHLVYFSATMGDSGNFDVLAKGRWK